MGVSCDSYTFPILSKLVELESGSINYAEMIHCVAMQMGFESDVYFCNTMIEAYAKSGCFENALKVFEEMPHRDLVSWTSMLSGYVHEGNASGAFRLFNEMRKETEPNEVTMIVMSQTCSSLALGRQFHCYVIKCGSLTDQLLKNSILKMYSDFGSVDDSEILFEETAIRDVVSWNIMISLYSSKGKTTKMAECFDRMRADVKPSIETLTSLVLVLAESGNPCQGRQLHCLAVKSGFSDDILSKNLLDLYAKSQDFENAIELFKQIVITGFRPVTDIMRSLVVICMHIGALRLGKAVHSYSIKNCFFNSNESVGSLETSILNMYVRCGNISSARICFDKMHVKDLVTWSSMIEGYGTHGLGREAFKVFHEMKNEGIEPNSITFLSLLSACSHTGLLQEGCEALKSMKRDFGIEPNLDHYTCIVDLLGRSGRIKEALWVILKLVALPDSRIWGALLAAARIHEDRKVGEYAVKKVLEMKSDNAGYYTLFSNVQASVERWNEVEEVRSGMKDMNLMKFPGWSCLEVQGNFHGFVSGDRSHHQMDEICRVIECLSRNAIDV
ncbi:hypothetical protein BUALT_Bualt12G0026300 [Buddleja alternifolia]|uniref:Pentatricopeptide repeat-containing protein n=1 Tax=Buddleja alternifolia TaxID=168488 RepID=A0AAV6WT04_9LAMI|nr:hypothetical protein BUALT_Bualt12G0026300 [Buddleja alternifolia]